MYDQIIQYLSKGWRKQVIKNYLAVYISNLQLASLDIIYLYHYWNNGFLLTEIIYIIVLFLQY